MKTIRQRQQGVALVTVLTILVIATIASLAGIRASRLEMRMSSNAENKLQSVQAAQALSDAVYANPDLVPVIGTTGFRICTPTLAGCDRNTIDVPGAFDTHLADGDLTALVTQEGTGTVPRGLETSADRFDGVRFSVRTVFDRSDAGLGRAEIEQGILVLTPRN